VLPNMSFVEAFLSRTVMDLTIFAPFALLVALALWRSGVWERRVIRDELASRLAAGLFRREHAVDDQSGRAEGRN
jgi:protease PrsW